MTICGPCKTEISSPSDFGSRKLVGAHAIQVEIWSFELSFGFGSEEFLNTTMDIEQTLGQMPDPALGVTTGPHSRNGMQSDPLGTPPGYQPFVPTPPGMAQQSSAIARTCVHHPLRSPVW